ncbi:transmembrane protein 265-like [Gadus chalcogrammus]|uniref:transmembrane protein 265-like n=1 Tax=Gadus chalcogrammus TaxID=1042646 RepID=UPI0024C41AF1|nr:transmembrane protein 265-like [Gadus chalcogrammus]
MDPEKAQIETAMLRGEDQCAPASPGGGNRAETKSTCIEISNCHLVSASLCKDPYYRRLAISSIVCGLSCIGIMSLIYSVQAKEATNPEKSQKLSKQARKYGLISIAVWVAILLIFPALLVLVSYVLTFID